MRTGARSSLSGCDTLTATASAQSYRTGTAPYAVTRSDPALIETSCAPQLTDRLALWERPVVQYSTCTRRTRRRPIMTVDLCSILKHRETTTTYSRYILYAQHGNCLHDTGCGERGGSSEASVSIAALREHRGRCSAAPVDWLVSARIAHVHQSMIRASNVSNLCSTKIQSACKRILASRPHEPIRALEKKKNNQRFKQY